MTKMLVLGAAGGVATVAVQFPETLEPEAVYASLARLGHPIDDMIDPAFASELP